MDNSILGSVVTVLFFVMFIAIVWWAYRRDNKSRFDEAAELPFREDAQDADKRLTD